MFGERIPRVVSSMMLILGVLMVSAACSSAYAQSAADPFGGITWRDVVYGCVGLIVVLMGIWSKRQDKDIAEARALALDALKEAHRLELLITGMRARESARSDFARQPQRTS